jgi:hypothetical protein
MCVAAVGVAVTELFEECGEPVGMAVDIPYEVVGWLHGVKVVKLSNVQKPQQSSLGSTDRSSRKASREK